MFTGAQIQGMSCSGTQWHAVARNGTQWHAKARGRPLFQNGRVRTRGHAWARVHSFSMVPKQFAAAISLLTSHQVSFWINNLVYSVNLYK